MTRSFLGKPIYTADNTSPSAVFQSVTFTENTTLEAARAFILEYNNPVYTSLVMKLWSDRGSAPQQLIATATTSWIPSAVSTLDHAHKEIYFQFSPQVRLRAGLLYHFTIEMAGYTGDATSHIAWANQWPDPYYVEGVTVLQTKAAKMPLALQFIGAVG